MPSSSEIAISADAVVSMRFGAVGGQAGWETIFNDVMGVAAHDSAYLRARFAAFPL
ncbi:MAG: hypothetical protein OXM58_05490 [Rhodospirillaceae bacterium]|nr:hypothetical protein [Rhodospirillaceae bacterium]MDE0617508.1 hypothetical protein [Rhodospirillaceae bacterium]